MFKISLNTEIQYPQGLVSTALSSAIEAFKRDMQKTLSPSNQEKNFITLTQDETLESEAFTYNTIENDLQIVASDKLGAIYALYNLSKTLLGVHPLWFFADQAFEKREIRELKTTNYKSDKKAFRYRGWFINDEVLFMGWREDNFPWKMAFEALLRLGGNLVIPGTDKNARLYEELALSMGLYITFHHAEPLGAEMFLRSYPDLKPSYLEHPELFEKLWRDAVIRNKNNNVIWTLGFRGQGDLPFWENDPAFDTDEKQGKLLNEIIKKQMSIVNEYCKDPIFAFNIYGEAAQLYRKGHLELDDSIIRIWGDNGYGVFVSRRQGLNNPRIPTLPVGKDRTLKNGMYYHASFYDLQAANHITPLHVDEDIITGELEKAYEAGVKELVLVNISSVKPHRIAASGLSEYWNSGSYSTESYFTFFYGNKGKEVHNLFRKYCEAALKYGSNKEEKSAEQFYTYTPRSLMKALLLKKEKAENLSWYSDKPLKEQVEKFLNDVISTKERYYQLKEDALELKYSLEESSSQRFDSSLLLYINLYIHLCDACIDFSKACLLYLEHKSIDAFLKAGDSMSNFEKANLCLRNSETGVWINFYTNEALADISFNVYLMEHFMENIRMEEDGPGYFRWQRELTYKKEDKNIVLLTNFEKHKTARELYEKYKELNYEDSALS